MRTEGHQPGSTMRGISQADYDAYRAQSGKGHMPLNRMTPEEEDRCYKWITSGKPTTKEEMGLHTDFATIKSEGMEDPRPAIRPVVQDWAMRISMMQQSVLFGIVRGPDGVEKYHPVKPILRWYRRCLLKSALDGEVITNPYDPRGGSFTGPSFNVLPRNSGHDFDWEYGMAALVDKFFTTMDQMPIHYWLHMVHAVEIMGYHHSDPRIAMWWNKLYIRMVEAMHLYPETKDQLDTRLGDTREGWLARSDPAITK